LYIERLIGSFIDMLKPSGHQNNSTAKEQITNQCCCTVFNVHPCADQQGKHTAAHVSQRNERLADISHPAHTMSLA
jgi:hypothetical protein